MIERRRLMAALALLPAAPALAQQRRDWPMRPVTILVANAAGGPADSIARALAQALTERLGAIFIVDNRPGGGGTISAAKVASAQPDGQTLLFLQTTHTIAETLIPNRPYRLETDLVPVVKAAETPFWLVANKNLDAADMKALVALGRMRPLVVANGGTGTSSHLIAELFRRAAGLEITHVPYRGTGPALLDLLAGRVDILFDNVPNSFGLVRDGQLKAIAVTSAQRLDHSPDLPTMRELGMQQAEVVGWFGLAAPRGTSPAILDLLNAEATAALRAPDLAERLLARGGIPSGGPRADFAAEVAAEVLRWREVITSAHITADE